MSELTEKQKELVTAYMVENGESLKEIISDKISSMVQDSLGWQLRDVVSEAVAAYIEDSVKPTLDEQVKEKLLGIDKAILSTIFDSAKKALLDNLETDIQDKLSNGYQRRDFIKNLLA